jgi:hypothetical protein
MKRTALLFLALTVQMVGLAQRSLDFAEKFLTLCKNDSSVKCVTVSPKMMEQMVKRAADGWENNYMQAIAKLKSMRIVTAAADYYQKAEDLLTKNNRRFKAEQDYRTDTQHGAFYTRKNKKGETVELIMLHENCNKNVFTIINVTGDIDEEFLCFLYNNKTFKN